MAASFRRVAHRNPAKCCRHVPLEGGYHPRCKAGHDPAWKAPAAAESSAPGAPHPESTGSAVVPYRFSMLNSPPVAVKPMRESSRGQCRLREFSGTGSWPRASASSAEAARFLYLIFLVFFDIILSTPCRAVRTSFYPSSIAIAVPTFIQASNCLGCSGNTALFSFLLIIFHMWNF